MATPLLQQITLKDNGVLQKVMEFQHKIALTGVINMID
jgi:hypothetical protein